MFIHTGIKSHKCDICGTEFTKEKSLKMHIWIHMGVKSHKCKICEKQFAHAGSLKEHMSIHTGEKPFVGNSLLGLGNSNSTC